MGGGGGGATGGGGGATGGGGGTTSDGGNAGTLAGALSFPIQTLVVLGSSIDGGADLSGMTVVYFDHAPSGPACNPTITVLPIIAVQFTVQTFDGGALRPGTYDFPLDVYGKREALTASSQEAQYITQGSITLTRLDTRSTGTLNATLDHGDGGTSTLSGTWDGLICP